MSKNNASVAVVRIEADGELTITPASGADPAALSELESLASQARRTGAVVYRYVQRPDRGGGGGEHCEGTTSLQSPRFANAFAHYVRSHGFHYSWQTA